MTIPKQRVHGLADQIELVDHALSAKEMARLLQLSPGQIYKLARKTIPSFRVCGSVRFDPRRVAEWLRNDV
jgi:excisionase family DNA binding protein